MRRTETVTAGSLTGVHRSVQKVMQRFGNVRVLTAATPRCDPSGRVYDVKVERDETEDERDARFEREEAFRYKPGLRRAIVRREPSS